MRSGGARDLPFVTFFFSLKVKHGVEVDSVVNFR